MFGSGEELDVLVLGVHSALMVMKQNAMVVVLGEWRRLVPSGTGLDKAGGRGGSGRWRPDQESRRRSSCSAWRMTARRVEGGGARGRREQELGEEAERW